MSTKPMSNCPQIVQKVCFKAPFETLNRVRLAQGKWQSSFPLPSGRKTRPLGATISGARHRCRLCSETRWAEFGYFKMVAPRAFVFRPLVKGNEDSGNEVEFIGDRSQRSRVRVIVWPINQIARRYNIKQIIK